MGVMVQQFKMVGQEEQEIEYNEYNDTPHINNGAGFSLQLLACAGMRVRHFD